jgi:hypothetical protein
VSDTPQGPGWWQASDGKWYPPEQAPGTPSPGGGAVGTLDTGAAIGYGWNKFVQYIGQIIIIVLIIFAVQIAFFAVRTFLQGSFDSAALGFVVAMVFTAVGFFVTLLLQAGLIRAALAVTRGETPEPSMLFKTENLGPYIVGAIIVSLLSFVGLLVCCIGYLVVAFFTLFWGYYVIDRGAAPGDAIKSSYELVKNNAGAVLVFAIVVIVLNLVTCGLAIGVTTIAMAYAYKSLNGEAIAA